MKLETTIDSHPGRVEGRLRAGFFSSITDFVTKLVAMRAMSVSARHLESFDDHMLKDIGVHRCEIVSAVRGLSHHRPAMRQPSDLSVTKLMRRQSDL